MANIVIVTKQCYLLCQSINYITVEKVHDEEKKESLFGSTSRRKKKLTAKQRALLKKEEDAWEITIDFIPVPTINGPNSSNRSSAENHSVCITVLSKDGCLNLFQDMVAQIREQLPDQLFLDKMVERFLTDNQGAS